MTTCKQSKLVDGVLYVDTCGLDSKATNFPTLDDLSGTVYVIVLVHARCTKAVDAIAKRLDVERKFLNVYTAVSSTGFDKFKRYAQAKKDWTDGTLVVPWPFFFLPAAHSKKP